MTTPEAPSGPAEDPRTTLVRDDAVLVERTPEQRQAARAARERRRERRRRRQRRRRVRRLLTITVVVLALLATLVFVWLRWTVGGMDRIPAALSSGAATPGTTILLVGSDPGAHEEITGATTWRNDLAHSDLVMLVHLPADHRAMYAVSIPGETVLPLPDGAGTLGSTAADGPGAYVHAVEQSTGVHVDHLAVLDLDGLREVTDELHGVAVNVAAPGCGEQAGLRTVDGQGALALMRLQDCLPHGDLDRVSRQQSVLRALLVGLVDGNTLSNPFRLNRIAHDTFHHLAVDEDWSLWKIAGTAWSMRSVTPRTTTFLTAPTVVAGDGTIRLDPKRDAELWQALRSDRMDEYVALNRDVVAGG